MTVVGLHPEELFDKLLDGELSPADSERLRQHLQGCEVCRFEYAARLDFQTEALELAAAPPPALPLRPLLPSVTESAEALRARAPKRHARRRLMMVGIAAAALITASAAVAATVVTGRAPWHTLGTLFSEPKPVRTLGKRAAALRTTPTAAVAAAPVEAPRVALTAEPQEAPKHLRAARRSEVAATGAGDRPAAPREVATPKEAPAKDAPKDATTKEPSSAAKLFGDANQARRSGDIGRASGLYHLLQDQFPGSPEAELSRVTLALLLLDSGDAQSALIGFERYLAGPSRGLEAEALVGRARALGRLGRRDQELSAWREVQRKYPRSIYGRQATERLSALGQP